MTSPTARTLSYCRAKGWKQIGVVERHNTFTHTSHDLFGFIDLMGIDANYRTVAIQACSAGGKSGGGHTMTRRAKIVEQMTDAARDCLLAGWHVEVWAWRKAVWYRKDGVKAKKRRWELRVVPVTFEDLDGR